MHLSIPIENTVEIINATEINPLISKCEIKVCYVGPNRNGTFISRETALEMGKKLPGSPIVGRFIEETADYNEHDRALGVKNGNVELIDITKPYGFVDLNAKVWFQQFLDEGDIMREYLVTEGYLWTKIYKESQRVIDQGNNHSMELYDESVRGYWSGDLNSDNRFFIINEAIIEKLCILGQDVEPCFEGAQIKEKFSLNQPALENNFQKIVYSLQSELEELKNMVYNKGGSEVELMQEAEVQNTATEIENIETSYEQKTEEVENVDNSNKEDYSKKEKEIEDKEDSSEDDEKEKKKYSLEEIPEYVELNNNYTSLQADFEKLQNDYQALSEEIVPLRAFRLEQERQSKQDMIDSFYMLSDEDKKEVRDNIDNYSLDDIESKLSVICFRNKVSFNLDANTTEKEEKAGLTFSLNSIEDSNIDNTPAWIKAVKQTALEM